jgi:16S rRNA (adenine1518-N6/adenine1519-N6)-dimethyltransferase
MGFQPRRSLGQNFLVDGNVLAHMVEAARLTSADIVLEIGPGLGTLTEPLLAGAGRVIAIEKDARLAEHLRERLAGHTGFELIEADALDVDLADLLARGVTKVVANLPYSVGSRILVRLFECDPRPSYIQVTVQKEVADRLRAAPGTADYGLLSVWAQLFYEVATARTISPTCFHPVPQVESAVVEMLRRPAPLVDAAAAAGIARIVKPLFARRRKQVGPQLAALLGDPDRAAAALAAAGIVRATRPEDIPVPSWSKVLHFLAS